MFKQTINCPRSNFSSRKSLRCTPLFLLILLWVQCAYGPNAQARGRHPSPDQSPPRQQNTEVQNTQEVTTLEPGQAVEREVAGGQEHSYKITLAEGQYASLIVEQRGIDVVVRLQGMDGRSIASFDSEYRSQGEEKIEMVAEAAGTYRWIVKASSKSAASGQYEIRVAELRAATENDRLMHEARKLTEDSNRSLSTGKYEDARRFTERALAISENVLGMEHPFVARLVSHLAYYHLCKQDFGKAESLFERSMTISEKSLGAEQPQTIDITRALGVLHYLTNERAKAERLLQRAVEMSQKTLGSEHYLVAKCLYDLARIMRDPKRKEELLQRALEMAEKTVGPEHEIVGDVLNGLGVLYSHGRDYQQAERFLLRAQAIYQKTLGPENLSFVGNLHDLGRIAHARKDYTKAEEYYRKSIAILEKSLGSDHPRQAFTLNNLAVIYHSKGEYAKSLEAHLRVLRIAERTYGPYHSLTTTSFGNIAVSYAAQGNIAEAIRFQSRVDAAVERNLELNLTIGSEREKLSYLNSLAGRTDRTISLNVNLAPNDGAASALSALVLLQRKGRLLDAMSESFASLRQRSTAEEQTLIGQYNDTTARLARLVLNGPQKMSVEEHQKKISELEEQKEQLEAEISRRSAEFRAGSQPVTLAAVQAVIPTNAALIEFAVYRPYDPKLGSNSRAYKEPRYIVYVLRRTGEVRWHDLGDVRAINEAIDSLRQALRDPLRRDVRERSRAVDEKVMQPVRALIRGINELLISPDGALNLVPFEALVDEQGRYLIQRYSFTYLTSGRDLLRMQVPRVGTGQPTVVANPSFGEPVAEQIASAAARPAAPNRRRRSVTAARVLSEVYFAPLSGTAREARTIQTLYPEANLLTGAQATESALRGVAAPRVLHVATHGFFLQDAGDPADGNAQVATRGISANAKIENPLLRSGLALAGANLRGGSNDDGILTALEASGLNLWGTKLVVLSACDTGLGEVRNGEGVYGLRRAFVLAGAESLVMTLWPVSDYSTRELMTNYHQNLKAGMGRGAALRQVQLDMLKRNKQLHPFYWANFIQSGEWANLDGKR